MPSPEDLVTIRDIADETGISYRAITSWRDLGYIKPAKIIKGSGHWLHVFWWRDVAKLLETYRPGVNNNYTSDEKCPAGCISIVNAAANLRIGQDTIRAAIRHGHLRSVRVPMNGLGTKKCFVYVEKAAIDKMFSERTADKKPGDSILPPRPSDNPLIDADHGVCLEARTALWEGNKRVFPAKYRIAVARKVKAG